MKDGMTQHTETQKKEKVLKLVKEINTRAKAKTVKIISRYNLRLFQEKKRTSGSKITSFLFNIKDEIQKKEVKLETPEKREENNQKLKREDRTEIIRTYN
jgi:hypothetical protein